MRGSAESAVAFADEIFARTEAVVLDEPVVDDARQVLNVGFGAVEELFGFGLRHLGSAEAGADGIDEDEVGEVEPCAGVVDEIGGVGGAVAFVAGVEVLGADGAEVQIDRGCAGTAVEGEGDRPVRAFHGVGGDDHLAGDFAVAVAHGKRTDGDGVVQGLAVELDGLLRRAPRGAAAAGGFVVGGFWSGLVFIGMMAAGALSACATGAQVRSQGTKERTREERDARGSSSNVRGSLHKHTWPIAGAGNHPAR